MKLIFLRLHSVKRNEEIFRVSIYLYRLSVLALYKILCTTWFLFTVLVWFHLFRSVSSFENKSIMCAAKTLHFTFFNSITLLLNNWSHHMCVLGRKTIGHKHNWSVLYPKYLRSGIDFSSCKLTAVESDCK